MRTLSHSIDNAYITFFLDGSHFGRIVVDDRAFIHDDETLATAISTLISTEWSKERMISVVERFVDNSILLKEKLQK